MHRIGRAAVVAFVACVCLGCVSAQRATNEPLRVFEAAGRRVVVDAGDRTVSFDGATLTEARHVADAVEMRGYLFVLQTDGVVHVYDLPDPETDGVATHVQRFEHLGRGTRTIIVAPRVERVLLLAAGSTEVMGMKVHEQDAIDSGEAKDPTYTDHARYMEFLRHDPADPTGPVDEPRTLAVSPETMALVTNRELLDIFYLDRSYRVLSRSPLPQGVARVDAIVHDGERWILAGLSATAEPVLMAADSVGGQWGDLGVEALDGALAEESGPIAWVPGQFVVEDGAVRLAIRGERGAVASWPVGAERLTSETVEVRWLDGPAR